MTAASAYPPEPSDGRPSEPSMEDILASIRRIIADDQSGAGKAAAPNGARRAASPGEEERAPGRARSPYDDVLDLARLVPSADRGAADVARAGPAAPALTSPQQNVEVAAHHLGTPADDEAATSSGLRARMPEPTGFGRDQDEEHDMPEHPVPATGDETDEELLSPPLGESVMSAFETLAATVVLQNTPMLERVMRDLLRPMLKTWLDDNLPGLVERLVRAEIERVARGNRG